MNQECRLHRDWADATYWHRTTIHPFKKYEAFIQIYITVYSYIYNVLFCYINAV